MATPPENSEEIARLNERCRSAAEMLAEYNAQQRQQAVEMFNALPIAEIMGAQPHRTTAIAIRLRQECAQARVNALRSAMQAQCVAMTHVQMMPEIIIYENMAMRAVRPLSMRTFKPCGSTNEECLAELHEKLPADVTPAMMEKGPRFG